MVLESKKFNPEVNRFLDAMNHPLRQEIDALRSIILNSNIQLTENVKWNGPNYGFDGQDRVTLKINPPKKIQVIFHRGVKKLPQPAQKLITTDHSNIEWKENDRAVITFLNLQEILESQSIIQTFIQQWINVNR